MTDRRNLSPSTRTAESPERTQRLEEKKHISLLNSRLENYILRVREREAELAEKAYESGYVKIGHHETTLSSIREEYDAKINSLNDKYNRAVVDIEELHRKLQREKKGKEDMIKQIKQLEQAREDLQQQVGRLSHELDVQRAKYDRDLGTLANLEKQLKALKASEAQVNDELDQLRADNRRLDTELAREKDLRYSAQQDFDNARILWDDERVGLLRRIDELSGTADGIEKDIRARLFAEFKDQLDLLLAQAKRDHDDVLAKQYSDFMAQLDEMRERESRLIAERDELRLKLEKLDSSSHMSKRERAENEKKIRELEKKIAELLAELEQNVFLHNKAIGSKDDEITRLKSQLRTIEDQRNVLLGLGVVLKKAVESYERIVDYEEDRIKIKKQKVSHSPSKQSASPAKSPVRASPRVTVKAKDISTPVAASPKKSVTSTSKIALSGKRKMMSE